jgi:predicted HD superfamily hydrolase involved in NAD metabolism
MKAIFNAYVENVTLSADIEDDVTSFLISLGYAKTLRHCQAVAQEAARLALRFGAGQRQANIAGWLHDVSAIIPNTDRLEVARALNIPILPEEARFPMLLHQKISPVMAREIFGINDPEVLNAIGCHTTLKASASLLDKILFVADKLRWDQDMPSPFENGMRAALEKSLDAAALFYLDYLWEQRESSPGPIHPWAQKARTSLHQSMRQQDRIRPAAAN